MAVPHSLSSATTRSAFRYKPIPQKNNFNLTKPQPDNQYSFPLEILCRTDPSPSSTTMPRHNIESAIPTGHLTPAQLASLLHVSPPTIRKMCKEGKLPYNLKPPSKEVLIPAAEALAALNVLGLFASKRPSLPLVQAARFNLLAIHSTNTALYNVLIKALAPLLVEPKPPVATAPTPSQPVQAPA